MPNVGASTKHVKRIQEQHRGTQTKLYRVWAAMRGRCECPTDKSYPYYGKRGIAVCREWFYFGTFRRWALANGYREGLTLDRRNNNGHYCPENCRWVTRTVSMRNTRHNVYLTCFGETKIMREWAEDGRCAVGYKRLRIRIGRGWPPWLAITTPAVREPGLYKIAFWKQKELGKRFAIGPT